MWYLIFLFIFVMTTVCKVMNKLRKIYLQIKSVLGWGKVDSDSMIREYLEKVK